MMAEDMTLEEVTSNENDTQESAEAISVTPLRALRKHCLWCCNGSSHEVKLCSATSCPLWTFRLGHRPAAEEKAAVAGTKLYPFERPATCGEFHLKGATTLKAIRRRCVDCSGGSPIGANGCTASNCDLHPFRRGKNPNFRIGEERRAKLAAALSAMRAQTR
jgi:hypothetical protein